MAKKNSLLTAPYDDRGNLRDYVWGSSEWRPNDPFHATLTYVGYTRGRSAAGFVWADDEGHNYPMFMKQMDELLTEGRIGIDLLHGTSIVTGTWQVVKRGSNYGIARIGG